MITICITVSYAINAVIARMAFCWVILLFYWDNPTFAVASWYYCNIRETLIASDNCCFIKGKLQNHKWENALTVDRGSWGYRRNVGLELYLNISQLIYQLASTVRWGLSLSSLIIKHVPNETENWQDIPWKTWMGICCDSRPFKG